MRGSLNGWFALAGWIATVLGAGQAHAETLAGPELADALRQGGYILLMRHTSSPRTPPDATAANADNKALERQLDEGGRSAAREMGDALRRLRIPIGEVLSSPTYRALETVRYAGFGEPKALTELGDGGNSSNMQPEAAGARSTWLRSRLSEPVSGATNTLIVTHVPNIAAAVGREGSDLADGETLVIRANGARDPIIVARVKAEQWPKLVDTTADEIAALKAENERLKGLVPSQSHAMMDVAYHFTNLWFAGAQQNWPLAQFYFNETRSHIRWAIRIIPVRRTSAGEVKLEDLFKAFDGSPLAAVQEQITAKNREQFKAAYRQALGGCNGCHAASEKPFLHVVIPTQPEARIIDFHPR